MLSQSKENWLLLTGIGCIAISLSFFFISSPEDIMPARSPSTTLGYFVVIAILVAPVLEELAFRGVYTGGKVLKIVALLLLPVLVVLGRATWVDYMLLGVFLAIYITSFFTSNKRIIKLGFIVNAALFAFLHWEYVNLSTLLLPLIHFGGGLVLIWTVLNFGLFRAILFHALYNTVAVLLVLYGLRFPDTSPKVLQTDSCRMEWHRVPLGASSTGSLEYQDRGIYVTNIKAREIHAFLSDEEMEMYASEPFMRYHIEFTCQDSVSNTKLKERLMKGMVAEGIFLQSK